MTNVNEIFRCNVCGNMVEVVCQSGGELTCCNQAMELLEERQLDVGMEKHIPVIEKDGDKIVVKVGDVPHPMEDEHYICFVELIDGDKVYRETLKPGEEPKAVFDVCADPGNLRAREYCSVHGLWPS